MLPNTHEPGAGIDGLQLVVVTIPHRGNSIGIREYDIHYYSCIDGILTYIGTSRYDYLSCYNFPKPTSLMLFAGPAVLA